MSKYPIFLEMSGRRAVVIGAGPVAIRKAESLLEAGARVVIVSDSIDNVLAAQLQNPNVELIRSKYSKNYLAGAAIVIAATNNSQVNKQIFQDCQQLEVLCNVVDSPELCDFFVPAVVKRGDLQVAVCTEGSCPAYAGHIRGKLESMFTQKHGEFLHELETLRKWVIENLPDDTERKVILGKLVDDESFDYFVKSGPDLWHQRAKEIIRKKSQQ